MIRRLLAAALLCAVATPLFAAQATYMNTLDLNTPTEGADTDQIIASTNLTDATTFALTAQPDVPRNVTVTVTDTTPSITAGTITITCLDVNGATITETLNLSGPTLTFVGTKVCASVVSVVSASVVTLGGAGDETFIVGTGSVVGYLYCSTVDPQRGAGNILTSGSSTTVTAAGTATPFSLLEAGDQITIHYPNGTFTSRTISSKNGPTSVVVDSAIALTANGSAGFPFSYRKRTCGTSDASGWLDASDATNKLVFLDVLALTATGGVSYSIECNGTADAVAPRRLLAGNITTAVIPGDPSTTLDPFVIPEECASIRIGVKFGTTDTVGTDSVSAFLRTSK